MSACVPGTRLETELITSNTEQEDNAGTSAPHWTERVGNNKALPLYIHHPADAMKAGEQVHTEWLLAEELSCSETMSGYRRTTLQSSSFEAPVAAAAKSQYHSLLPAPPPLASHSCRGRPSFWQLPPW